jgi:hypothetical protein
MKLWSCLAGAALVAGGIWASPGAARAAVAGSGSRLAAPAVGQASVEVCGTGAGVIRPGQLILTCADDGELGVGLTWSSWTTAGASATGAVTWNDCSAKCKPDWKKAAATFHLSDPVAFTGAGTLFTTLDVSVTGRTPAGFQRTQVFNEAPLPARPSASAPAGATSPSTVTVPAGTAPSGQLAYGDIEGFWDIAGGNKGVADIAAAITGAESSFLPGIIQPGVDYCDAGSDRAGWGLWQITCGNEVRAYGTDFQLLDPWNNAEAAVSLYDARGFEPWTTYEDGAYRKYLRTNVAANQTEHDLGEFYQINATPPHTPASPPAAPGNTYGPIIPTIPVSSSTGVSFTGYEALPGGLVMDAQVSVNPADAIVDPEQAGSTTETVTRYQLADGYVAYAMTYNGSTLCLNLQRNSTDTETQLLFYACSLSSVAPNEQFRQADHSPSGYGTGYHLIVPAMNWNRCANAKGGQISGTTVILYPCNSQVNEAWADN